MPNPLAQVKKIAAKEFAKKRKPFIPGKSKVTVGWPVMGENEVASVLGSLLELRISQGEKVRQFEQAYAKEIGMGNAIAVNSGSSANLVALDSLLQSGRVRKGSEVIVPAATFTTVASPILQLGLVPVFVDAEQDSYNIDPKEIESAISPHTGLIMPVHSLGNPAKMPEIMEIAQKNSLPVLEDCCESHGATIGGKSVGSFGDASTLSFFVAHNITTGEGGMIFCKDSELADMCRSVREFGRRLDFSQRFPFVNERLGEYDVRYVFDRLGYNVRMTDIEASIGLEQLKKLPGFNRQRIRNAAYLSKALSGFGSFQLPQVREGTVHSFYGFPIMVEDSATFTRRGLVDFLEKNHIETRPFMGGNLAIQPAFSNAGIKVHGSLPVSNKIAKDAFFIGCHPGIGKSELEYVAGKFEEFMKKH